MIVTCVGEGVVKPRDDDDDDDVFASTEDSVVPAVASIDSKRRSQSLSALCNDNPSSQTSDVTVSDVKCNVPELVTVLLTIVFITLPKTEVKQTNSYI